MTRNILLKNRVLTDFKTERWRGVKIDNILKRFDELKANCKNFEIYGQIFEDDYTAKNGMVELSKISHVISNVRFDSDEMIFRGDVKFLETPYGKMARMYFNSDWFFGIRAIGNTSDHVITFEQIVTWDLMPPWFRECATYLESPYEFFYSTDFVR